MAFICAPNTHAQDFDFDTIGYIDISKKRITNTKIKSIKEESGCYIDQENPPLTYEDCETTYKETYDKNGNLISLKTYEDGSLQSEITYTYKNNRIASIEEDYGDEVEKKVFVYNLTGKLMFKKEYENKTLEATTTYKYNSQGLLTEEIYERPSSKGFGSNPYQKTIYKYNTNGKCIYKAEYNKAGVELDVRTYEYSNNGLTKVEKDKRDDTYVIQFKETKDARGNSLEKVSYDYDGKQQKRMVNTYDANNNRLSYEEYDGDDKFVKSTTETFNDKNDVTTYTIFYPTNHSKTEGRKNVTRYWYKYDKKGNWTERASYEGDEKFVADAVKRSIRYY